MPRYRVAILRDGKKKWLPWMEGMLDTCGFGEAFGGIVGAPVVDMQLKKGMLGSKS